MNTFLPILKNTLFSLTLLLCSSVFAEEHDDLETVFSDIYKDGGWGCDENGISISGHGSTPNKVQEYLNCLNSFLDKYRIKTIVDIGCGDFNLGKHLQLADRNYIGIDVAKSMIQRNQKLYNAKNISFLSGDAITMPIPPADLVICKDVLSHLSIKNVMKLLNKLNIYKYCIITNDISLENCDTEVNSEIQNGHWRPLDLTKAPFNLSVTPILVMRSGEHIKVTILIKGEDLKNSLDKVD